MIVLLEFLPACVQNSNEPQNLFIDINQNLSIKIFLDIDQINEKTGLNPDTGITIYYYRITDNEEIYFYQKNCAISNAQSSDPRCLDRYLLNNPENIESIAFFSETGFYGLQQTEDGFFYSPEVIAEYPERLPSQTDREYYCSSFSKVNPRIYFSENWYCTIINHTKCPDGEYRYSCGINPHPIEYLGVHTPSWARAVSLDKSNLYPQPSVYGKNYSEYNRINDGVQNNDEFYFFIGIHHHAIKQSNYPESRFVSESSIFRHQPDQISQRFYFQIPSIVNENQTYRIHFSKPEFTDFPKMVF